MNNFNSLYNKIILESFNFDDLTLSYTNKIKDAINKNVIQSFENIENGKFFSIKIDENISSDKLKFKEIRLMIQFMNNIKTNVNGGTGLLKDNVIMFIILSFPEGKQGKKLDKQDTNTILNNVYRTVSHEMSHVEDYIIGNYDKEYKGNSIDTMEKAKYYFYHENEIKAYLKEIYNESLHKKIDFKKVLYDTILEKISEYHTIDDKWLKFCDEVYQHYLTKSKQYLPL